MALTVRRRPGVDLGGAVGEDLDLAPLLARRGSGGDLDVDGHTDAQLLGGTRRPACGLVGSEGGVIRFLQSQVERLLVVTAVIGCSDGRGVGKRIGPDQVLSTEFDRVHPDLCGIEVDHPLGGEGRFGPTGTAVGRHGSGIRQH